MKEIIQNSLLFPELIWERPVHYYKNEGGKVLIVAGARGNPQRAILACESVFRSGTGVLTLAYPQSLNEIYKAFLPDTMKLPLLETFGGSLGHKAKEDIVSHSKVCDIALIGPGLSNNAETIHLVWDLIFDIKTPIVLVDDGVQALTKGIEVLRQKESENFMIDYFKKTSQLFLVATSEELVKILHACNFQEYPKINASILNSKLKEITSFLHEMLGVGIVVRGNGGLAVVNDQILRNVVGSCDSAVLEGMVASFLAQNPEKPFEAVATALYLHGISENLAKQKIGDRELLNSDILRFLPEAIKTSENH